MSDNQPMPADSETKSGRHIIGEEDTEGRSTPAKDFLAAVAFLALAIFAVVMGARLKNPGSIQTHPGLLPVLTGLTLGLMAIGLGLAALRQGALAELRGSRAVDASARFFGHEETRRTLLLIAIIFLYVLASDLITFDLRFQTSLVTLKFSSYEATSILMLTLVLRIFWRQPLWRCALLSVVFILLLASIFRYGFHILMPGAHLG